MIKLGKEIAVGDTVDGKLVREVHVYGMLINVQRQLVYVDGTTALIDIEKAYNVTEPAKQDLDKVFSEILQSMESPYTAEAMCACYVLFMKLGMSATAAAINKLGSKEDK